MCASIEAPSQAGARPVAAALTEMGLDAKGDVVLDCGHRLDLELEWRGERLGILVEGPNDFMSATLQPSSARRAVFDDRSRARRRKTDPQPPAHYSPKGGTLLRRRQVECLASYPMGD